MVHRIALSAVATVAVWALSPDACRAESTLTEEEVRTASRGEGISLPCAGEWVAAFDKAAKTDWTAAFRKLPAGAYTSRPQIALNLGVLFADGHVAVGAQNRQELKNISREIRDLAKSLGLDRDIVGRSNTIAGLADGSQWNALSEELESEESEMASAMNGRQDRDLATLMALGGWLRALDAISGRLAANYTSDGAMLLRQPATGAYFTQRLAEMPAKIQASPMIADLRRGLPEIQAMLSLPPGPPPSAADATKLNALTGALLNAVMTHEK